MTVCRITVKDIEAHEGTVLELIFDAYESGSSESREVILAESKRALQRMKFFLEDGSAIITAAFDEGGDMAGLVWAYEKEFMGTKKFHMPIGAVHSNYRGRGVYTLLFEHIAQEAKSMGVQILEGMVASHNEATLRFYKKLGFEITKHLHQKRL